jgi:acyl-CoA dehydrogenase
LNALTEISWAAPAYRSIMAIGNGIVNTALTRNGSKEQKQKWLPSIAKGAVAAFAITEPGSGSDSAAMRSMAVRDGDHYVLNGVKRYISNAPFADVILVIARTSHEDLPKNGHISAFLVPTDTPGVSIGKPDKKMGQQGAQIADVIFENARLPLSALLGEEEGKGFQIAMNSLNNGRLSVAAASLGSSKRALDSAIRYGLQRTAFGEKITSFQLIQAKIADSQADIYAMECMLRDAASKLDQGLDIRLEAACVKMFASEACGRIVDRVVQIYGGAGYIQDYDAERFFRDSRLYRIFEGTTEIMQLVIARTVLQEYEKGLN